MQCQVRKPDKSEVRRRWCPGYQVPHNFDTNKWEKSTQVSEFERIETNVIAPWNPTSTDRVEDEVEQSWDGKDREKMGKKYNCMDTVPYATLLQVVHNSASRSC